MAGRKTDANHYTDLRRSDPQGSQRQLRTERLTGLPSGGRRYGRVTVRATRNYNVGQRNGEPRPLPRKTTSPGAKSPGFPVRFSMKTIHVLTLAAFGCVATQAQTKPEKLEPPLAQRIIQPISPLKQLALAMQAKDKPAFEDALNTARGAAANGNNNLRMMVAMLDVCTSPQWPEIKTKLANLPLYSVAENLQQIQDIRAAMAPTADLADALVFLELLLTEQRLKDPKEADDTTVKTVSQTLNDIRDIVKNALGDNYEAKVKKAVRNVKQRKQQTAEANSFPPVNEPPPNNEPANENEELADGNKAPGIVPPVIPHQKPEPRRP